jgi:hypothetical protein
MFQCTEHAHGPSNTPATDIQLAGNFENTKYQQKFQFVFRRSKNYINTFQNMDKNVLKVTCSVTGFHCWSDFYLKPQMCHEYFVLQVYRGTVLKMKCGA